MRAPSQISRNRKNVNKHTYGHLLIIAGSQQMLGAGALSALSALRAGAGMVTLGIPKSLNIAAQKKCANEIMTLPLAETSKQTISLSAFKQIKPLFKKYAAIALGPGLSTNESTKKLIFKIISQSTIPLVIDADALNAVAENLKVLKSTLTHKILTPHTGEMSRLTDMHKNQIEDDRKKITAKFAMNNRCTVLLKGPQTVIATSDGRIYTNKNGNPGMATAGSGDVLTGILGALLSQGVVPFEAAKFGAFAHGRAADIAAAKRSKVSMIASDIIENLTMKP